MKASGSPPKFFLRFFQWYCDPKMVGYIEGDLMQVYGRRLKTSGKKKADWKFMIDVLLLFRPGIIKPIELFKRVNTYDMYQSYFKIAWRNLAKNKGFACINIGGLAVGMAVSMLIGLWIYDELSYNQYFRHYDRIATVLVRGENSSGPWVQRQTSPPFGNEIRNLYGAEFKHVLMASMRNNVTITAGDIKLVKTGYPFF